MVARLTGPRVGRLGPPRRAPHRDRALWPEGARAQRGGPGGAPCPARRPTRIVSYGRGQQELALALERWPLRVWEEAAGVAAEIDAVDAFAAGLRLLPRGAELAKALGLPATDQLDWEIRHVASRPRGTFHLQALADKRGLLGRAEVLRHALLPSRAWIAREYPWARRGGARLVLGYVVHLMRAPAWAVRAWRFRRRSRRAA